MKIVIDIGGSVMCPEGLPDSDYLKGFRELVLGLAKGNKIVIVTGGGGIAKKWIDSAEKAGAESRELRDWIGIRATWINASVMIAVLGRAYPRPALSEKEAAEALETHSIVVMGGLRPKQTTDAVSVQVAQEIRADLIAIATNVKGVYTKNPLEHKDAEFLEKVAPKELVDIVRPCEFRPGHSAILDPVAAELLTKAKLKTLVLDGRDLKNLEKALKGKEFIGTTIE